MDKYYCYIFYDDNWCAYYVGYASYEGRFRSRYSVPIPDEEHRQIIRFKTSWEALECERELVSFWGRECDGGCLKNKAVGGTIGPTGIKHSKKTKQKISAKHKGKKLSNLTKQRISETRIAKKYSSKHITLLQGKPITVRHIQTGNIRTFPSHREMERQIGINRGCISRRGKSKGWELVERGAACFTIDI